MSLDKHGMFAKIFLAMMIFCALVWVWTVAFIITWPWDKTSVWKPEFRVAAVCKAEAKSQGLFSTLVIPTDAGDVMEEMNWLKWKKTDGVIEVKASSWHFQTTIRYTVENETPVLVEYQDVGAKALYFGMAAGLFSLIGLYLRKLRS